MSKRNRIIFLVMGFVYLLAIQVFIIQTVKASQSLKLLTAVAFAVIYFFYFKIVVPYFLRK